MKIFRKISIMLLVICMAVMVAVPCAWSAYYVKGTYVRFSATAGETLTTGNVVCLKDADGYAYKADANDATLRPAIGIVGKGGTSGQAVEIIVQGVLSGWTSLSEGAPGYLSETAAAVTQSAPSYSQQVGMAISSTQYFFNFSSYLDTSSITSLGTLSGGSPLVLEGATADASETTIAVTDPTADRTFTLPDASGVPILSAGVAEIAHAITGGNSSLVFEGATADASETTITVTDPTGDRTVTLADGSGTVMLSSLATNAPDAANAVTGASNGLLFEGATANDFETTITATDPTADRTVTLADGSGTVMLSSLATNAPDAANAVTGASNGLLFEGATADGFETTVTVTDPTADNTVTLANASGTVMLSALGTNAPDVANSIWGVSGGINAEGATADGNETTITFTDPTADRTVTLADASGTVMLSALATNAADAANAVTGASNGLLFEGATANDHETTITVTDPTADRTITLPDASGVPILSAGVAEIAHAITGGNSSLVFEGATADASETTITVTDPTGDRTITIPDGGGTVMLSSLATNATDAANAVTGASNGLVFEGATADGFETTITATDPTADRTVTLANASGTVMLSALATNAADAANAVTGASNGLLFEGATADAFEATLTIEDPTTDNTYTLPDYTGAIPIVIGQSSTQTSQAGVGTSDVTGSSLSIAAGWLTAGKTIRWTLAGTLGGGNAAPSVHLYLSDATVITLTFPAATVGDWVATIILHENTGAANQDLVGRADTAAGAGAVCDYAAATKDVSGAVTAKAQIQSANAGDTITCEYVLIETWTK